MRTLIALLLISLLVYVRYIYTSPLPPSPSPSIPNKKLPPMRAEVGPPKVFRKRVIGLGDIHGDLSHATRILRMAGLIDLKGNWVGEDAILVQTGDIVDRGKDTIALYRFFDTLRPQAEKAGGGVVSLLGNHEIMNAMGDWRYVTPEDIATFGGERQRRLALSSGWIGQTWRSNYSITARIPFTQSFPHLPKSLSTPKIKTPRGRSEQHYFHSHPVIPRDPFVNSAASFVHGGITPAYLKGLGGGVGKINEVGKGLMESLEGEMSPMQLPRNATSEQREFWSERGPMWDRTYAMDEDETAVCARAAEACEMLGVSYLLMGHTPHFEGIRTRCDGQVILIDTGISRAYGGSLSALEILFTLTPSLDNSINAQEKRNVWNQQEVVSALYTDKRGREELGRKEKLVSLPWE